MKAITLTQPWATLVALGSKRIETRSWATPWRGPIAIHSSKLFPSDARDFCYQEPARSHLKSPRARQLWSLGAVLAIAELKDVQRIETLDDVRYLLERYGAREEYAFGNFQPGRFAWILDDVTPVEPPVQAKGMLGVWEWEREEVAR